MKFIYFTDSKSKSTSAEEYRRTDWIKLYREYWNLFEKTSSESEI